MNRLITSLLNSTARIAFAPETGDGGGVAAPAGTGDTADQSGADAAGEGGDATSLITDAKGADDGKPAAGDPADPNAGAGEGDGKGAGDPADGDKPGDGKPEPTAEEKAAALAAPFEGLKPPEGFAALDEEGMKGVTPILRELGVATTEQAQGVIDQFAANVLAPMLERAGKAAGDQLLENAATMRADWAKAVAADAELGGANLEANMALVAKARDTFGTPELNTFLKESGLGNHPDMVRFFHTVGRAISEDTIHKSDLSAQGPKHPWEKAYDPAYQGKQPT